MTAEGWMPAGYFGSGKNSGRTLANPRRALGTRINVLEDDFRSPATRTAEAALFSARANQISLSAKVRSPLRAVSAGAKPVSRTVASPSTVPPSCAAISAAVYVAAPSGFVSLPSLSASFIQNLVFFGQDDNA